MGKITTLVIDAKSKKINTLIIMVLAITVRSKGLEDVVFKRRSLKKQDHH
jgi:hypothetical protein